MVYEGRETFKARMCAPRSWNDGPVTGRVVLAFCEAYNAQFKGRAHVAALDVQVFSASDGRVAALEATRSDLEALGVLGARLRRDGAFFYETSGVDAHLGWPRGRAPDSRAAASAGAAARAPEEACVGPKARKARAKRHAKRDAFLTQSGDQDGDAEEALRLAHLAVSRAPGAPLLAVDGSLPPPASRHQMSRDA